MIGDLPGWAEGLAEIGVDLRPPRTGAELDLVVAPPSLVAAAADLGPRAVLVEGRADARLRRAGFAASAYLARPHVRQPSLLVPFDQPLPARYAIASWSVVDTRWKQARRAVATRLAAAGRLPALGGVVTAGASAPWAPYVVAAATAGEVPAGCGWVLTLGQGDALSRNVFHLFPPGSASPRWVAKFARVPGRFAPFAREEEALRAVESARGALAARAPRLLRRFQVDGLDASVETAARGRRLRELLVEPGGRGGGRRLVDAVASWTIAVARDTAQPATALESELDRLRTDVLPHYAPLGVGAELLEPLRGLPATFQHNDLGTWNVIFDGDDFVAVDWESSSPAGLPLWDLVYFLADALALLDGAVDGPTRHRHTVRLFRGDLPSSGVLFGWIGRAVEAIGIEPTAVGPLVTACWMHHALSPALRERAFRDHGLAPGTRIHGTEHNAQAWLTEPGLGPRWDAWRRPG